MGHVPGIQRCLQVTGTDEAFMSWQKMETVNKSSRLCVKLLAHVRAHDFIMRCATVLRKRNRNARSATRHLLTRHPMRKRTGPERASGFVARRKINYLRLVWIIGCQNFFVIKMWSKNTQFGIGNTQFWKNLKAKLSEHQYIRCRKVAAVCWKTATFCPCVPPTFFYPRRLKFRGGCPHAPSLLRRHCLRYSYQQALGIHACGHVTSIDRCKDVHQMTSSGVK